MSLFIIRTRHFSWSYHLQKETVENQSYRESYQSCVHRETVENPLHYRYSNIRSWREQLSEKQDFSQAMDLYFSQDAFETVSSQI